MIDTNQGTTASQQAVSPAVGIIQPTVGRVVWLHRPDNTTDQPEAALITFVHGDRCINVAGWNNNGTPISATSVHLLQPDAVLPEGVNTWAEWMPYQKGQAARSEQLAARLGAPAAALQRPSKGRIVIFRDGTGNEFAAIITRVYDSGRCALRVFRDDSDATHSFGLQEEVDPTGTDMGWFWPPRT